MAVHLTRRRFTVDEYNRMAEAGILSEDDRVELIDGEIIEMTPIGERHANAIRRLNKLFSRVFGDDAIVDVQDPVILGQRSEPQPDLAVLRPRTGFYASHPTPADGFLLVEVADSSLAYDRRPPAAFPERSFAAADILGA